MADERDDSRSANGWDAELARLRLVDGSKVRIWHDAFRRLHVQAQGGEEYVDVRPARAFPVTGAADYISFLDGDDREVLLVRDPGSLDPESLESLRRELAQAYFVPKIVRIYEIEDAHGAARWEVETDRGHRVFDVRDREDVRVIRGTRVLLQDADGNRFEIEDLLELDERSRRLLDKEI